VADVVAEGEDWNSHVIAEFRANAGKVGGELEGAPLLLLTTTGAKTEKPHTTPLLYLPYGDRLVVFASKAGADAHPDWYYNVVAYPWATVEVRHKIFHATATIETGEFRDQLFDEQVRIYPDLGEFQRATTRKIPAVSLRMAGQPPR
jgi:deazaflavin-dependent oxidoreductase (nitroreductase family)